MSSTTGFSVFPGAVLAGLRLTAGYAGDDISAIMPGIAFQYFVIAPV